MKLNVTGIETIEATDPNRLTPPVASPQPQSHPDPWAILPTLSRPYTPRVNPVDHWKWGRGLPPTSTPTPTWEENWQSREQMKEVFDQGYHQITQ